MSKAEMRVELVPQVSSYMLLLHTSPVNKNVSSLRQQKMWQAHTISNAISTISYDLPNPDVLLSHSIGHIEQKGDPKTWQKDVCFICKAGGAHWVSANITTHSGLKAACFVDLRWRLWPWQHFDSDHARDVRTRQVVQLLSWLDSKLLKTYRMRSKNQRCLSHKWLLSPTHPQLQFTQNSITLDCNMA